MRTLVAICWRRVAIKDYSLGCGEQELHRGVDSRWVDYSVRARLKPAGQIGLSFCRKGRISLGRRNKKGYPKGLNLLDWAGMAGRILVTGVSGPIGTALLPLLQSQGYNVVRLVRGPATGPNQISWNPAQALPPQAISGFEAVIHLAGESIVGRWTEDKKTRIRESRAQGTKHLCEGLAQAPTRPRVLISGSAIGFYGDRGEEILTEDSASGEGFLPSVCRDWEAATQPALFSGIRTVNIRIGLVLSKSGGALQKMLLPFRMGAGGRVGTGRQWWSWIDVEDIVGAIHHIIKTDSVRGPINLVAPNPVTNAEFTKALAQVLHRPAIFPVPAFAARLAFGQMADELLLASQRVSSKLASSGYAFQHSDLRTALQDILHR